MEQLPLIVLEMILMEQYSLARTEPQAMEQGLLTKTKSYGTVYIYC